MQMCSLGRVDLSGRRPLLSPLEPNSGLGAELRGRRAPYPGGLLGIPAMSAQIFAGLPLFFAGRLLAREWRDCSADLAQSKQEVKVLTVQVEAAQGALIIEQS